MEIIRYFINSVQHVQPIGGLVKYNSILCGNLFLHRVILDSESLRNVEIVLGIRALPGMNAPASALNAALLVQMGITPLVGETVINVLRRWRDANGFTDVFDIS